MMDSFVGLPGTFDIYRNIQTVGEEFPDVPFTTTTTNTVSVAAIASMSNQAFSGSPSNG